MYNINQYPSGIRLILAGFSLIFAVCQLSVVLYMILEGNAGIRRRKLLRETVRLAVLTALSFTICSIQSVYDSKKILLAIPDGTPGILLTDSVMLLHFMLGCSAFTSLADEIRYKKNNITRFSIIEAVDRLDTGIVFAEVGGRIILMNSTMVELVHRIAGHDIRRADAMWNTIMEGEILPGIMRQKISTGVLLRFEDGSAWEFSRSVIQSGSSLNYQITADDKSILYRMIKRTEETNMRLREQAEQVREIIENIEEIKREKEIHNIKSRIHDVLGERISLLQKFSEYNFVSDVDYDRLLPLFSNLMGTIRSDSSASPDKLLENLQSSFEYIGTKVNVSGSIPQDQAAAALFILIIREAVTNAVRHAKAQNVYVRFEKKAENSSYSLTITNDGRKPEKDASEGGGISGMRRNVLEAGGKLDIRYCPEFMINAEIPAGIKS